MVLISRSRRSAYSARLCFRRPCLLKRFEAHAPLLETLAGDVFEEAIDGVLGWHAELGKRLLDGRELDVAALRDVPGAVERILHLIEQRHHFFARFDVERRLIEAHPVRVRHRLPGLDAKHDFVGAGVVFAQVVRIVGGDQRNACVGREAVNQGQHFGVGIEAMVLQFEKEIVLAEQVCIFVSQPARIFVLIGQQRLVHIAAQAGRQRDQALGVAREQIFIDARLVIEAFEIACRDQLGEVAIAFLVFAEQDKMVVTIGIAFVRAPLLGDVHFAADDRDGCLWLWRGCRTRPLRTGCRDRSWRWRAFSVLRRGPSTAKFRRRRRAASNRYGSVDERKERISASLKQRGRNYHYTTLVQTESRAGAV